MMRIAHWLAGILLILATATASAAESRDGLILTQAGVERIRAELGNLPLFDATLEQVRKEVDAEIAIGIDTPIPRDFSGGYTHQRHKANFFALQKSGALFKILEQEKYAIYVRDMLFQYEAMYADLPLHPQTRSYARGKLFWQCLNDANWLVYAAQAYDSIYDWLSAEEREQLETNLFRPFADHLSVDSPQFFNRVHNHSTWGAAAVGMIGLVMQDQELIDRALYGLEDDGLDTSAVDNDGGFIKTEGQEAGFFANLNEPFSPDGYYTEGPYYQRYAMYPFLIFAQALNNARPDLGVLDYKDGVLLKAVDVLLNLADADGEFYAINDGQKGMSIQSYELVTAVDIAYRYGGEDSRLLSIAQQQGRVQLDDTGYAVAAASRDGLALPFEKRSANYSDGADGDEGGLALLRYGDEELSALFKYSAQGLSHGHYDKLSLALFEHSDEVLQDYGLARFVNIEQKGGGNYLPENTSWAKQSIAHNTLVIDQASHFAGSYEIGSQHHSQLNFYDASNPAVQVVSARENNAYPGTELLRTIAVIKDAALAKPFVLDLFKASSAATHQFDLPFHYFGQVLDTNFDYEAQQPLARLGDANGYQHLYLEAVGAPSEANAKFSWMSNNKFYTLTSVVEATDALLLARLGANDPQFNLRRDPAYIIRRPAAEQALFASIIEPHGSYDRVTESALDSKSHIASLSVVTQEDAYTAVAFELTTGERKLFIVANQQPAKAAAHALRIDGADYRWTGPFLYTDR
ncbi:MAG: heparinase II/III family protein [Gammaproteobacteria bacterium]|nr:heparinase II/III family protein [Gammaproteobacteria bacterium]